MGIARLELGGSNYEALLNSSDFLVGRPSTQLGTSSLLYAGRKAVRSRNEPTPNVIEAIREALPFR